MKERDRNCKHSFSHCIADYKRQTTFTHTPFFIALYLTFPSSEAHQTAEKN